MLDIFLGRREQQIKVDRLKLIGDRRGAVFAFHRPEHWDVAGIEIRGATYHAVAIDQGRITRIEDYPDGEHAMSAAEASSISATSGVSPTTTAGRGLPSPVRCELSIRA